MSPQGEAGERGEVGGRGEERERSEEGEMGEELEEATWFPGVTSPSKPKAGRGLPHHPR